jgi:hypothetical protein
MRLKWRIILSLIIVICSFCLSYKRLRERNSLASDFQWSLRAAQAWIGGNNPYETIRPTGEYPFSDFFRYPIYAAIVAVPFINLDPYMAGAAFFSIGSGLMALGMSKEGWKHFPVFLSSSYIYASGVAQWSPYIFAAALITPLHWLILTKPNLGLCAASYKPSLKRIGMILIILFLSLFLFPEWQFGWLEVALDQRYLPPALTHKTGLLLIFSLMFLSYPEGRLLLTMALAPQLLLFYDQLLLWLIPKSFVDSLLLTGASWLSYFSWNAYIKTHGGGIFEAGYFVVNLIFLPSLILLLKPVIREIFIVLIPAYSLNKTKG